MVRATVPNAVGDAADGAALDPGERGAGDEAAAQGGNGGEAHGDPVRERSGGTPLVADRGEVRA
jgi:hypothetical protein